MSLRAVSTMMGRCRFIRRNSCSTARPLRPGSLTSSSTRSQGWSVIALRPVSASPAKPVLKPTEVSSASSASRTSGSSSTMRMLPLPLAMVSHLRRHRRRHRKLQDEGCALARLRAHLNGAVVFLHDAVGDGQAEAGAAAGGLGGEEGVVNLAQVIGGNTDAGVGDLDANPTAAIHS